MKNIKNIDPRLLEELLEMSYEGNVTFITQKRSYAA